MTKEDNQDPDRDHFVDRIPPFIVYLAAAAFVLFCLFILLFVALGGRDIFDEGESESAAAQVVLRGRGTATRLNIGYTFRGSEEQFADMVRNPWEKKYVGFSGDRFTIEVQPVSDDGTGVCEIEVDGKVVAAKTVFDWVDLATCSHRIP